MGKKCRRLKYSELDSTSADGKITMTGPTTVTSVVSVWRATKTLRKRKRKHSRKHAAHQELEAETDPEAVELTPRAKQLLLRVLRRRYQLLFRNWIVELQA